MILLYIVNVADGFVSGMTIYTTYPYFFVVFKIVFQYYDYNNLIFKSYNKTIDYRRLKKLDYN